MEVFNSPYHCKSLSFGLTAATFHMRLAYATMFVPPSAVACVRIAPSPTGLASTFSSVLREELKYFMTSGVAMRALRQSNACCCSGPHTYLAF